MLTHSHTLTKELGNFCSIFRYVYKDIYKQDLEGCPPSNGFPQGKTKDFQMVDGGKGL